jgi:DNA polymerase/3'-5' exonuclease PolX
MSGSLSRYRPTISEAAAVFSMIKQSFDGDILLAGSGYRNWNMPPDTRIGDLDLILVESDHERESNNTLFAALFGHHKNGKVKTKGVLGQIQVDFFRAEHESWGATLLFYRLPRQLQIAARAIASASGMRFGPKGIFDCKVPDSDGLNKLIPTPTITDAYNAIGIQPFSREQLRRGAEYVFSEALNK